MQRAIMTEIGALLQPLLQPTLATLASILGVAGSDLMKNQLITNHLNRWQ